MLAIMADLMSLIESEIPEGRQSLKDSHTNLEKVAEYCENMYFGADNKRVALEDTKNFATQSLASVAYMINTLAYNVLHLLDLQSTQLAEMESHISYISQTVSIHKEKVARREIGVLTTNKNTTRQHKIMAPASPERPIKYIRKPIDYSILDDIGHGVKSVASRQVKRTLSHVNGGVAGPAPTTKPPTPPQSVRSLSRGSKEYRTPVAPPQVPSNYATNYPVGHRRGSGYSTLPLVASSHGPQVGMVHPMTHHHTLRQPPSPPPPPPGEAMRPTDTLPDFGNLTYPRTPNSISAHPRTSLSHSTSLSSLLARIHQAGDFAMAGNVSPPLPPPPPPEEDMYGSRVHYISAPAAVAPGGSQTYYRHPGAAPSWVPDKYLEKVVAIYDYAADKEDELSFSENSVIYVIKKNDDGWYEGVINGTTGLFPGNYVEPCL